MTGLISKRLFVGSAIGGAVTYVLSACSRTPAGPPAETFEITRTPDEWRRLLTAEQFEVLREAGTERPGTSPLDDEKRAGTFTCAGCALPVYRSEAKYDSGTGWPSFTAPIEGAVRTRPDPGFFGSRTEVPCRRCGGHLGHVFDDGPAPTGLRYCMNGIAMNFVPAA